MHAKWMWTILISGFLALAANSAAWAQPADEEETAAPTEMEQPADEAAADEASSDDAQPARPRPEVVRRPDGPRPGGRTPRLDRLERMLLDEIEADEQQHDEIEQLFADRRREYAEEAQGSEGDREEQQRMMREMLEQMREARAAGDEARMAEIRDTLRSSRAAQRPEEITDAFTASLEELLDEQQVEKLHEIMTRLEPGANREEILRRNPRLFYRQVQRLDLDDDQRGELEDLFEQTVEEMRDKTNPQEREAAVTHFHESVMNMLSDEQKAQLKEMGRDARRSVGKPQPVPADDAAQPADENAPTDEPQPETSDEEPEEK